jgi:hypothetical protein
VNKTAVTVAVTTVRTGPGTDQNLVMPSDPLVAIFRALVQKYGPIIAKELLCAWYGVCG